MDNPFSGTYISKVDRKFVLLKTFAQLLPFLDYSDDLYKLFSTSSTDSKIWHFSINLSFNQ